MVVDDLQALELFVALELVSILELVVALDGGEEGGAELGVLGVGRVAPCLVKDSAVTGVPSVNFQPSLSLMVYWVASSLDLMDSATSLEALPLASKEIRRANSRSSGLPPPVSLQSPGMSGFCGSELYAVMTLEPYQRWSHRWKSRNR